MCVPEDNTKNVFNFNFEIIDYVKIMQQQITRNNVC